MNPATEELIRSYPADDWNRVQGLIARARAAFDSWRGTSLEDRKSLVHKLAERLRERKNRYGSLITLEMGKPIAQSEIEIDKCARGCDYYAANAAQALEPQIIVTDAAKSYVRYDPLGLIVGIMPWNFPFWQVFRFAVPALMAGNVVILKHAPNVPACAREIEVLFREVGFPEGVFQSLFLTNEDAARLIDSGSVRGVSLTGSDRAGSAVAAIAGKNLVKTVLELGGSDPFIVFKDADLDKTIPIAVKSRMLNTGQSCIAAKRFFVAKEIFQEFSRRFVEAVKVLKVGDPTSRETDIGPLAREDLLENLVRQTEAAKKEGAEILLEGGCVSGKGYFFRPMVFQGIKPGMTAFQEEVFGPVASLAVFDNEEEAIALANKTCYGLGASLWTRDVRRAEALVRDVEAGSVFINGMVKSDPRLPFGGVKRSGHGRELSTAGLHEFVNIKTVWIG